MKRRKEGQIKAKLPKRLCVYCGKEFQAIRKWHDYCSRSCRQMGWRLKNTDPAKVVNLEKRIVALEEWRIKHEQ